MTQLLHYSYDRIVSVANAVGRRDGAGSEIVTAGGSVAIGNFDGLHRGHIALLKSMQQPMQQNSHAARSDCHISALPRPWVLLTFEPHPRSFFSSHEQTKTPLRLSTIEQKHRWLEDSEIDIDSMVVMRFDEKLSMMPAQEFVENFLLETLGAKHLVVGEDFAFGRNREGTLSTLQEMSSRISHNSYGRDCGKKDKGSSFRVHCFPTLLMASGQSAAYSSTRARELLRLGKLHDVRDILGRDFEIEGVVIKGKGLGSRLGFPTANIDPQDYCRPLFGVYCVRVMHKGKSFEAVASFGKRPTLGEGLQPLLEVHFFDCPQDLYGSKLQVSFEKFQREEENYASLDALRLQIAEDVRLAKQYFREAPNNGDILRHSDVELSVG